MYKKIHIKNAIFLTIRYKVYLKFTVKFHDSQNERNMIRFLEGSKTNGKANSEHYFDILSPSMSLNSASFQPRKVKFYAKILRNQFFFFFKFRIKTSKVPLVGLPMMLLITGKEMAKQRETASVEKIYCGRHLLFMGHKKQKIQNSSLRKPMLTTLLTSSLLKGTQRQFLENICQEDDLRSRIFGTFVKFLACLLLLGFSNI